MNKYIRKLLGVMFQSQQTQRVVPAQAQCSPSPTSPEEWRQHWQSQGQSWRTEPEIDAKRQEELSKRRAVVPDTEKGIYPFKEMKLSRADIEWLLATHENGRGPVDWNGERQRKRAGLDLRGADLRQVDLHHLPLAMLLAGLRRNEWFRRTREQEERAATHLEGAILFQTHLQGAFLSGTHLENANLVGAQLTWAFLGGAQLKGADVSIANLNTSFLGEAHLEDANLHNADLSGANLTDVILSNRQHIGPKLADVHLNDTNLAVVDWSQITKLGDEWEAQQKKTRDGKRKEKDIRLKEYRVAVRANRQLAVILQTQGLIEDAVRFAYRAQVLQKGVSWFEMLQPSKKFKQRIRASSAWLYSWFLFLLAGYGYKPGRSFLAYILIIVGFAAFYLGLDGHLVWYEAVVVSMTAFHGRGFSPSTFSPSDPLSIASAFEAFVGLIIEVTFIATLTRRFFGQ